jgi:hypothetical protein
MGLLFSLSLPLTNRRVVRRSGKKAFGLRPYRSKRAMEFGTWCAFRCGVISARPVGDDEWVVRTQCVAVGIITGDDTPAELAAKKLDHTAPPMRQGNAADAAGLPQCVGPER